MATAAELLASACTSGISCLSEKNLLVAIAQGASTGGGGSGGGGGTLSTDGTFAANSDLLYPSQKAAKTYVDAGVASAIASSNATADSLYVKKAGDTMTGALLQPAGTAGAPALARSTDPDTGLWYPGADLLAISTGGTERLRIIANGNVGIGVSPLARLHITPSASGTDYFRIDHSDGTPRMQVGVHTTFPTYAGLWMGSVIPSTTNYTVLSDSADTFFNILATGNWALAIAGLAVWKMAGPTGHLLAGIDNTYDIGASGATRPRDVFVARTITTANLTQTTAGLFSVTSGANQRAGDATLVGGTVTVANTTVTANTRVFAQRKAAGGTIGMSLTYTVSAATSFTISSDNVLDTSTYSYLLIEVP